MDELVVGVCEKEMKRKNNQYWATGIKSNKDLSGLIKKNQIHLKRMSK